MLVDGALGKGDREDDLRGRCSGELRRHGVNLPVITDPYKTIVSISGGLPGRTPDLSAARLHRTVPAMSRLGHPRGVGEALTDQGQRHPEKAHPSGELLVGRAQAVGTVVVIQWVKAA
ncbi:hypothetical protein ACFVXC_22865 [Streptomyces sp. NPDC058257]|uniref:hypothetical protein n=1 Tax=Streptomyces sp. NPDC058257 TaxID=3346409 RepID=UPI0036ED35EF